MFIFQPSLAQDDDNVFTEDNQVEEDVKIGGSKDAVVVPTVVIEDAFSNVGTTMPSNVSQDAVIETSPKETQQESSLNETFDADDVKGDEFSIGLDMTYDKDLEAYSVNETIKIADVEKTRSSVEHEADKRVAFDEACGTVVASGIHDEAVSNGGKVEQIAFISVAAKEEHFNSSIHCDPLSIASGESCISVKEEPIDDQVILAVAADGEPCINVKMEPNDEQANISAAYELCVSVKEEPIDEQADLETVVEVKQECLDCSAVAESDVAAEALVHIEEKLDMSTADHCATDCVDPLANESFEGKANEEGLAQRGDAALLLQSSLDEMPQPSNPSVSLVQDCTASVSHQILDKFEVDSPAKDAAQDCCESMDVEMEDSEHISVEALNFAATNDHESNAVKEASMAKLPESTSVEVPEASSVEVPEPSSVKVPEPSSVDEKSAGAAPELMAVEALTSVEMKIDEPSKPADAQLSVTSGCEIEAEPNAQGLPEKETSGKSEVTVDNKPVDAIVNDAPLAVTPTLSRSVKKFFNLQQQGSATPQDIVAIPSVRPTTPIKRDVTNDASPDAIKRHLFDSPSQKPTAIVRPCTDEIKLPAAAERTNGAAGQLQQPRLGNEFDESATVIENESAVALNAAAAIATADEMEKGAVEEEVTSPILAPTAGYNLDFLDDPNFDPFVTRSGGIRTTFGVSQPDPVIANSANGEDETKQDEASAPPPPSAATSRPKKTFPPFKARSGASTADKSEASDKPPKEKKPLPPKPWLKKKVSAGSKAPEKEDEDIVIFVPDKKADNENNVVEEIKPVEKQEKSEISPPPSGALSPTKPVQSPLAAAPPDSSSPPLRRPAAAGSAGASGYSIDFDDPNFNPFETKAKVSNNFMDRIDDPNCDPFATKSKVMNENEASTTPPSVQVTTASPVKSEDEPPPLEVVSSGENTMEKSGQSYFAFCLNYLINHGIQLSLTLYRR